MKVPLRRALVGFLTLISLGMALNGGAAALAEDSVPGSRYISARASALGGAFLPLAEDIPSALFYNPAGLATMKLTDVQAEPFNLLLNSNTNYPGQFQATHPNFYKVTSLSSYTPTLQQHTNDFTTVGGQLVPAFYLKGFAFGLMMQSQVGAVANGDGTVSYRSTYRLVPTAGVGVRLAGGIVRFGYSLQWVNQSSGQVQNAPTTSATYGYNQGLLQGSELSHTVGFALTLPYVYLPQLNIVGRNLFSTGYAPYSLTGAVTKNPSGDLPKDPMTFDASVSYMVKIGGGTHMTYIFEDRDFTGRSGMSILGRLAGGVELSIKDAFFLRGGWGSGYPSAGLGFRRKQSEISLSWTNEEIGTHYHDVRDTKILMQYQIRAF